MKINNFCDICERDLIYKIRCDQYFWSFHTQKRYCSKKCRGIAMLEPRTEEAKRKESVELWRG